MQTPSCSQCKRARRNCYGYRTDTDTIFRSQNKNKIKVEQQRPPKYVEMPNVRPVLDTSSWNMTMYPSIPSSHTAAPIPWESGSLEDQASTFFFETYWKSAGEQDTLVFFRELYKHKEYKPAVNNAIVALGLLGIAAQWHLADLFVTANNRYNLALRLIIPALEDPLAASKDETLATIMLLAIYEVSTPTVQRRFAELNIL